MSCSPSWPRRLPPTKRKRGRKVGFTLSTKDVAALGRARQERGQSPLFPMPAGAAKVRAAPAVDRHAASGGAAASGDRVLACDPSSQKFGWGVVEPAEGGRIRRLASGRFMPSKAAAASDQYTQIVLNLVRTIEDFAIGVIVFEVPSGNVGYRMKGLSAASYGRAVEIPHAVAVLRGLAWQAIDVKTWKENTGKSYTRNMVHRLLAYEPKSEDESDALGLGCWYLMRWGDR